MKSNQALTLNRVREENLSTEFDCGGRVTCTTISNYSKLKVIKPVEEDMSSTELIEKLDSLESEPAVEYPDASGARLHIKKLIRN